MNTVHHESSGLEIAIVGMAGRFPGAPDVDTFWQRIQDGVESVKHYTDAELAEMGVPEALRNDPDYVKAGVVPLDGFDRFDAEFFGFTPREAEQLDPQQRLFLESAWTCLEHAGCDPARWPGKVGVYGGEGPSVYLMHHLLPSSGLDGGSGIADVLGLLGANASSSLCTRVAYKLNLRGPAVSVQTACSTSLMAVHMACQALLGHECDMALAGGVWLNLLQQGGYRYQAGAILSPDGHCRAFDADAAGTVIGSGVGVLALKRLEDALRDGDTVHAVIKGSAANNDGSAKVGFTAPGVEGQAEVIRAAQLIAGVSADTVGYVEAHGTGTALGDPIEIAALTQAFRADTERRGFCAVGSVKTNVGHLDAAAGVAGLIKAAMALKHRQLPPSLHCRRPHPQIDFAASPFYVNTAGAQWPQGGFPRRAGVSSFGIGGTNVHVVLEEAPAVPAREDGGTRREDAAAWEVLPVSARTEAALRDARRQLAAHLPAQPGASLEDVAHTLQSGRKAWAWRVAVVAHEPGLAAQRLDAPQPWAVRVPDAPPEVVFLFPGAGSQHVGMARDLYRRSSVFREALDACAGILLRESGLDLRALIHPPAGGEDAASERLARMDAAQPALFAVEYAMARWWMSCGVRPALMLGHSLGEYVAACLAGVFSIDDAMRIVAWRGQLMATLAPGAMTSVALPEAELGPFLGYGCDVAAINGDATCVLAGTPEAVERTEDALRAAGHLPRRVHVSVASHSRMVEPIVAELERRIAAVPRQAPQLPFVSNVTGRLITAQEAMSPAYWGRHLRGTVRFRDGLGAVLSRAGRAVLEVGPGEAMAGLARQHADAASAAGIWASQAHPLQHGRHGQQLAQAVAGLWMAGVDIDWRALRDAAPRRTVPLPTYPFQRQRYWVEAGPARAAVRPAQAASAPCGMYYLPRWRHSDTVPATGGGDPGQGDTVLLLGGAGLPLADRLARELAGRGARVVRADSADTFGRQEGDRYGLRPGERTDHAALWQELGAVSHVFHCWGLEGGASAAPSQESAWERGYFSLMALAQGIEDAGGTTAVSLTVVADGIEEVAGTERLVPEKATLLGIAKVLGQEMPHLVCRVVDVVLPPAGGAAEAALARALADEPLRPADECLVAWRGAHRCVRTYEPAPQPPACAQRLRPGSVVLITGGLGGVGLALARYLGRAHGARLVLTGRTPLPPRGAWPGLLAQPDLPAVQRRRLEQLQDLDARGIQWMGVTADTTDARQWHEALEAVHARFGGVNGVIHAVVEPGRGMLANRTKAEVEAAFAPKVRGTQALMAAVRGEPLDFVLLCSSVASLIGGLGRSDYAAANAYLDAFATACRRDIPCPVFSVNWDAWRDVGIAVDMDVPDGVGLDERTGTEVFERIVNGPAVPQTVVSVTPLAQRLQPLDGLMDALQDAAASLAPAGTGHPRPVLSNPYRPPEAGLESHLADLWTEALGIGGIGVDDNLFELGGDSLLAIRLLSRVRKAYGVEIHPAAFFKAPTVSELAQLVELRLIEDLENEAADPAGTGTGTAAILQTQ